CYRQTRNDTSTTDERSINITHFALPHLMKSKGRIVVIGS
nr:hydroxysteroid dehydrogenase 2 [Tanacetum cinerariifolium]